VRVGSHQRGGQVRLLCRRETGVGLRDILAEGRKEGGGVTYGFAQLRGGDLFH